MSIELTNQITELQAQLDASAEQIAEKTAWIKEHPSAYDVQDLQDENRIRAGHIATRESELVKLRNFAEIGKTAIAYGKEFCIGAYVEFELAKGKDEFEIETSDAFLDFCKENAQETNFIFLMRTSAGFYRRARNERTRNPEKARGHTRAIETPNLNNRVADTPFGFNGGKMRKVWS